MIPSAPQNDQSAAVRAPGWQHELRHAFSRPAELLAHLELDPEHPDLALSRRRSFALRVPRGFVARMRKGDPHDPLLRQIWPAADEDIETPGYVVDAVGDLARVRGAGLIHKYHGRVLLVATGACAVHCRYCFRRHFPYNEQLAARDHWAEALAEIAVDTSVDEVILSGGDPLSLSDDKLGELIDALDAIPHLRRLRVHTRQPIVLPERIDERLLAWLDRTRLQTVFVLHANHPNELDDSVMTALEPLRRRGITLLNQAVLLRQINDDVETLVALSERLFGCGVLPYYLHLLDRVQGAAHFDLPEADAQALMRVLSSRLPGYLVPRLVREIAGAPSKTWIDWDTRG
ncbi:EF-P beta-lysylation protein EpmB [Solimonas marina]|uniref:L-lysine 2,3-aminomutase n=1 Tax=Solimonas marina TaxID=2714601 RepID=A0A969WBR3_9GAMM|nr:EF-P beta-lysylation protein EpmB [Solimonas marina]NKF23254.1 EF-P beta-lysylation protein EpmB [Solimonas marina]